MDNSIRYLIAAALLATLAACGNKGPLVRPSHVNAREHAHMAAPDATDPTTTAPVEPVEPVVPASPPAPATAPPATPPGAGNG